jgi:hypothetical protein
MGLFDVVREKAAELLSGAGDKVSELTGAELPDPEAATDQLAQAADTAAESVQSATDAAADTGVAEGLTDAASEAVDPHQP